MTIEITRPTLPSEATFRPAQPSSGMQALIGSIAAEIESGERLDSVAARILTFGGRQSIQEGWKALTPWQREVLTLAAATPVHTRQQGEGKQWWIGMFEFGRIYLCAEAHPLHVHVFGCIEPDVATVAACAFGAAELRVAEAAGEREIEQWLDALDDGQVRRVVQTVREAIDHIDPVLIYVREETFTNFSTYNNLLHSQHHEPGRYVLDAAAITPPRAWSGHVRTFIACFWWMLEAGARGEEANGRQLTPATLSALLDERARALGVLNETPIPADFTRRSIAEKAAVVREQAGRANGTHLVYRSINGLTFAKDVHWIRNPDQLDLPPRIAFLMRDHFNLDPVDFESTDQLFGAVVHALVDTEAGIESLMEAIVGAAIEDLPAHVGMTRGIRDLGAWQRAVDANDAATACGWDTASYYCGVVPSASVRARFENDGATLLRILNAISRRMEYNSWHYIPGHFDRDAVPRSRHFFYPPQMPDVASWADIQHPGHVRAHVRYSIRAPEPLEYRGRRYEGMIDLRLMRMNGEAFSAGEMMRARAFSRCLRALSQALADSTARQRAHVINGFRSSWYERRFGLGGKT
jgi:hypothetical protein